MFVRKQRRTKEEGNHWKREIAGKAYERKWGTEKRTGSEEKIRVPNVICLCLTYCFKHVEKGRLGLNCIIVQRFELNELKCILH